MYIYSVFYGLLSANKSFQSINQSNVSKVDVFQGRVASKINNKAHVDNIITTDNKSRMQ